MNHEVKNDVHFSMSFSLLIPTILVVPCLFLFFHDFTSFSMGFSHRFPVRLPAWLSVLTGVGRGADLCQTVGRRRLVEAPMGMKGIQGVMMGHEDLVSPCKIGSSAINVMKQWS